MDSYNGHRNVWHGGGPPGFSSHFVRFVDDGITVITLANGNDVDSWTIANGVARLYLPTTPSTTR